MVVVLWQCCHCTMNGVLLFMLGQWAHCVSCGDTKPIQAMLSGTLSSTFILYWVYPQCMRLYWVWIFGLKFEPKHFHSRLLDRGKMFVFSRQHLHRLLPFSLPSPHITVVLDIGSGDGHVTDKLRGVLGSTINVTETSGVMRRVLKRRGYQWADYLTIQSFGLGQPRVNCFCWNAPGHSGSLG